MTPQLHVVARERPVRAGNHASHGDDAPTLSALVKQNNVKEDAMEALVLSGTDKAELPELTCVA